VARPLPCWKALQRLSDDLHAVAPAALRHRLLLNFEGLAEGVSTDTIIAELLDSVKTLER
jgi:MoxR-like ATPase